MHYMLKHIKRTVLAQYLKEYLENRPFFMSFIRPQEAYFFYHFSHLVKRPILDLGCGDGFFIKTAYPKKTIDIGLDLLNSRAEQSRPLNIYSKILYFDGVHIPKEDKSVQTVVSNCVLEHVEEILPLLKDTARVLKPGGYFLTSVMAAAWEDNLLGTRIAGSWYRNFMKKKQDHHNLLTEKEWTRLFKKAGFEIVEVHGYVSPRNAHLLDLAHYLSAPSLISHISFKRWVAWKQWHEPLRVIRRVLPVLEESMTSQHSSSAYFYVLKKT